MRFLLPLLLRLACSLGIGLGLCSAAVLLAAPPAENPITDDDRAHWAYQPLTAPRIPTVPDAAQWQRTPIDTFILQKLQRQDLTPQDEAPRGVLLRRITYDLTGLPPTPAELAAFQNDADPAAYERAVDRLLASPAYGERWGQHWLDLARFAETDGFEHDKTRPNAWKYRDWVIRAFNRDLSYRDFLRLQLAGDEIAPDDADAQTATMFCLAGPDMPDINDQGLRRHNLLNELTATVGSSLLAMQFGCAQCHDHKYDPISQADFFRLRAIFDPAVPALKRDKPINVLSEKTREATPSFFYTRGEFTRPDGEIAPAFPRVLNADEVALAPANDEAKSTQRRAALADWLTRPEHPLTARVIVNRLWQHHFGHGLVGTSSDFGLVGDEPTHPALLDYLATELIAHDWSLKHVQRLIVTSSVYRQASSASTPAAATAPPALYARFPRKRLEAEALRDALLAISGELNLQSGGPGVLPPLAPEIQSTLLKDQWKVSTNPADHARRSVYIFARRNLRYPLLEAFDRADPHQSCPARHESTTAPQALMLFNGEFAYDMARKLAGRLLREHGPDPATALAPLGPLLFARELTPRERELALRFLESQAKRIAEDQQAVASGDLVLPLPMPAQLPPADAASFVELCLALINTNEFVYLD